MRKEKKIRRKERTAYYVNSFSAFIAYMFLNKWKLFYNYITDQNKRSATHPFPLFYAHFMLIYWSSRITVIFSKLNTCLKEQTYFPLCSLTSVLCTFLLFTWWQMLKVSLDYLASERLYLNLFSRTPVGRPNNIYHQMLWAFRNRYFAISCVIFVW